MNTEILKALVYNGIVISLEYDTNRNEMYANLNTNTKSHLYLYEDGTIRGRYDYESQLDLSRSIDDLIVDLCNEFENATHDRSFGNDAWIKLCEENNVKLNMIM